MKIDDNIKSAIDIWIKYGINPGSCTEFLLRGDYEQAFKHAHPLLKPHWNGIIEYIESLPDEFRGKNYDTWKGKRNGVI